MAVFKSRRIVYVYVCVYICANFALVSNRTHLRVNQKSFVRKTHDQYITPRTYADLLVFGSTFWKRHARQQ